MLDRFLHGLLGAFLGALIAVSSLWYWMDEVNWFYVAGCSGVRAILAFAWGPPFIEWLKEVWWWS